MDAARGVRESRGGLRAGSSPACESSAGSRLLVRCVAGPKRWVGCAGVAESRGPAGRAAVVDRQVR